MIYNIIKRIFKRDKKIIGSATFYRNGLTFTEYYYI